jgi:hypothetical protein
VADVGVPRTIQIAGVWPGCSPVGARVIESGRLAPTTRVVQMILPQTLMPCPAAFLPYTASATFTPTSRGIDRLLIHNVDGEYLGESLLDTRAPDDRRSAYNITGMWYDPASNGSGLTFVHSRNAAATTPCSAPGTSTIQPAAALVHDPGHRVERGHGAGGHHVRDLPFGNARSRPSPARPRSASPSPPAAPA